MKLREITEEKDAIDRLYLSEMQNIFRTNLDFKDYTPLYDYYHEFYRFVRGEAEKQVESLAEVVKLTGETLHFDELYNFNNLNFVQTLQKYYSSLFSEYSYLTDINNPKFAENKKSDYYKICLKGLLLQLIEISNSLKD